MLEWGTLGKKGVREEMPGPCGQGSEKFKGAVAVVGPTNVGHAGSFRAGLHYGGEGLRSVKSAWPRHGYMRHMVDVPEKN